MEADFSGYATKAGLKCSDGRTIMAHAFKNQDKGKVPLVWQHGHSDPGNVLGHTVLENREDGVYAYGFFNDSPSAVRAKGLVQHGDITMLSIWANDLIERSGKVLHGAIREVSLVLSGANPGALIENVTLHHSDGDDVLLEDEVIIYTGLELEHSGSKALEVVPPAELVEVPKVVVEEDPAAEVVHATGDNSSDGEETIQDIYDSMSEKQKNVLHFMVGQAIADNTNSDTAAQSAIDTEEDTDDKEGSEMTRNVFEQREETKPASQSLSHSDVKGIVADATRTGSLKDAVESYALSHGIEDIDVLFPDAMALDSTPEWLKRRTEWVGGLLSGVRKSPFSRIKTISADLTVEEARAKGYITGTLKKEEFFGVAKRVTTPTTVYKKQKLDRDDMVDITDFDVVAWLKAEMRLMLDEEIARAILIGDGRDIAHEDKINEGNIRPIANDHELYTTVVYVNIDDASSSMQEVVDALILNRRYYKGTGLPTMYTTETFIARFLLHKDTLGRAIYSSLDQLATELRVAAIVAVEVLEEDDEVVAILVNPNDYVVGATRGGEVSMFDDFDIDYNQYKYLIETRMCGCLVKLKSAMVVKKVTGTKTLVTPTAPTFDEETGHVTITNTTGVVYKRGNGTVVNAAGSPYTIAPGVTETFTAEPDTTHYFSTSEGDSWTFTTPEA